MGAQFGRRAAIGGRSSAYGYKRAGAGGGRDGGREEREDRVTQARERRVADGAMAEVLGFEGVDGAEERVGWLTNFVATQVVDEEGGGTVRSGVDCFFMCEDGSTFRCTVRADPYFYVIPRWGREAEVEGYLQRKFGETATVVGTLAREDLDLKNHLSGVRRTVVKVQFRNTQDLVAARHELLALVEKNRARGAGGGGRGALAGGGGGRRGGAAGAGDDDDDGDGGGGAAVVPRDFADFVDDLREYDVPYHVRYAIDHELRCGQWWTVKMVGGHVVLRRREDMQVWAEPRVCAFDIETTKKPLRFPDVESDAVFMISYMVDRKGYLITNREVVGEDISDFEYTPRPEYESHFTVFNEPDERALLERWYDHLRELKPGVFVSYNGDYFDWPFLEARSKMHGIDMYERIGFRCDEKTKECKSRVTPHLDCLYWVKRDSYLPQGSQGLKAVTKAKLRYDPHEIDMEEMIRYAQEQPQVMATYSVSDAVCTYHLYMTYVHPFIFALCHIIPMPPDEVLRKGSGTLCETLLMVEAFRANVVCPNKKIEQAERYDKGKMIDTETYIGGHVEALESGIFRADLPVQFNVDPRGYEQLLEELDDVMRHALQVEHKIEDLTSIANYDEVKEAIAGKLADLRDRPRRMEPPMIYHLDVAAMYPNIILTNRLQPPSVVTEEDCAACVHNRPDKNCLRKMDWVHRVEHYACTRSEVLALKNQLEVETIPPDQPGGKPRFWRQLSAEEKHSKLIARVRKYSHKVYRRLHDKPVVEKKSASLCMRENGFYYDTVLRFRDRRYEYKGAVKDWKKKLGAAEGRSDPAAVATAKSMMILNDSLQLAHKCILNSFYGYVMRRGARWYSMEMAGVVTHTGANIIQMATRFVNAVGLPLELDTDGIWCCLPATFPDNFDFRTRDGKKLGFNYPCSSLNHRVAKDFTNHQYQVPIGHVSEGRYETRSECTIEFEVDGPYKAMILPAARDEGKSIKKRYAVFNFDGSLAELKGFELKRRGELKLVKIFQSEVFNHFLDGGTLEEAYDAVSAVANRWVDMLENEGSDLAEKELLEYISESSMMSKSLEDMGTQKSARTTTALRLAEFLGAAMVKDAGLNCTYIVSKKPDGAKTTERCIPTAIFQAEPAVRKEFLRKWLKDPAAGDYTVHDILDWNYYFQRLGNAIQKIITIPAAMQNVKNPCPRVVHPDWLKRRLHRMRTAHNQRKMDQLFEVVPKEKAMGDLEDLAGGAPRLHPHALGQAALVQRARRASLTNGGAPEDEMMEIDGEDEQQQPSSVFTPRGASGHSTGSRRARSRVPNRRVDFNGWLKASKRVWKEGRAERKKRRAALMGFNSSAAGHGLPTPLGGSKGGGRVSGRAGAGGRTLAPVSAGHWQVLSVNKTSVPGELKMWVLAAQANQILGVPLHAGKRFYVAARADKSGEVEEQLATAGGRSRRVSKAMPRCRPSGTLFEVECSPESFRDLKDVLSRLKVAGAVQGVYESGISEVERAVLEVGCVTAVGRDAQRAGKGMHTGFDIGDLSWRSTAECKYLEGTDLSHVRRCYLYLASAEGSLRGVATLVLPAPANKAICIVIQGGVRPQRDGLNVGRIYEDAVSWRRGGGGERDGSGYLADEADGEDASGPGVATARDGVLFPLDADLPSSFVLEHAGSNADALRQVQRLLADFREELTSPLMCVAEVSDRAALFGSVPALAELPVVAVPANASDATYPALSWQGKAVERSLKRFLLSASVLEERLQLCRFAHIPVGNLEHSDPAVHAWDTMYGRQLRARGHVSWKSTTPGVPDLGGDGDGGEMGSGDRESSLKPLQSLGAGEVVAAARKRRNPGFEDRSFMENVAEEIDVLAPASVSAPGVYRSICVSFSVHHLAVNSLLNSGVLAEMEGNTFDVFSAAGEDVVARAAALASEGVEDATSVGPVVRVLRQLLSGVVSQAVHPVCNESADTLLQHFQRWAVAEGSHGALYEPLVHYTLAKLMEKVFRQLVDQLRRLGCRVVHASYANLIIATGKHDLPSALAFADYVVSTVRGKDLFEWVDLQRVEMYHCLVFRDVHNYGGVRILRDGERERLMLEDGGAQRFRDAGDGTQIIIDNEHWNLANYLPDVVRSQFLLIVSEFMYRPWDHLRQKILPQQQGLDRAPPPDAVPLGVGGGVGAGDEPDDADTLDDLERAEPPADSVAVRAAPRASAASLHVGLTPGGGRGVQPEAVLADQVKLLVATYFSEKILRLAAGLRDHYSGGASDFPEVAGKHVVMTNVAAEFAKMIVHVLGLDRTAEYEVIVLRRNVFRLLNVPEFGSQSQFVEPCRSYTLHGVVCEFCNDSKDLDMCRDPRMLARDYSCGECGHGYRKGEFEGRLVRIVRRRLGAYASQDMVCKKCGSVKASKLQKRCECNGEFQHTIRPDDVLRTLATIKGVADYHGFHSLAHLCEVALNGHSNK